MKQVPATSPAAITTADNGRISVGATAKPLPASVLDSGRIRTGATALLLRSA